jgi:hypothetical protein
MPKRPALSPGLAPRSFHETRRRSRRSGGLPVVAAAAEPVDRGIDVVADRVRRAVSHRHHNAPHMGAAEAVLVGRPTLILGRYGVRPAEHVEVVAGKEAVVVADVEAGRIVVGVQVFLTDEIRAAHPVSHMRGPQFAALGGDRGGIAVAGQGVEWAQLDRGQDAVGPAAGLGAAEAAVGVAGPASAPAAGWEEALLVEVLEAAEGELSQVVAAGDSSCRFPGRLHGREEQGDEHSDDRNDRQQFNKREARAAKPRGRNHGVSLW